MSKIITSQNEEIEVLKEQLERQKQRMEHALKLADQALACRPPPRVYAFCLKEQYLFLQLMLTLRNVNAKFKTAQDFYGLYQTLPPWQHNILCELYVHNFVIPVETKWNPLLYIRDVHLKAFMSWMLNEANYDRQLVNYRDEERTKPLPLRVESRQPKEMLQDWFTLTYGKSNLEIRKMVFVARAKVYAEYENFPYFAFQRAMTGVRSRWARLPNSLKK